MLGWLLTLGIAHHEVSRICNKIESAKPCDKKYFSILSEPESALPDTIENFTSRNKTVLSKYEKPLKAINGDDFNIYSATFDEYNKNFCGIEESEYIASLTSALDRELDLLKSLY